MDQQRVIEETGTSVGVGLIVALCLLGAIWPLWLLIEWGGNGPNDFTYFWEASQAALGAYPASKMWFPYSPHALLIYVPFALLPFLIAWAVYNLYGLALFLLAARRYLPAGFPAFLTIFTPAVLTCVLYGQTGLLVGALWLWAFSGKWQAVALLTFKPHLGILSALSLNRKTLLPTVLLAAGLMLASAALFWEWWPQFFSQVGQQSAAIGVNTKWPYIAVGPAIGYGFAGWAIFAGAALYLLSRRVTVFSAATAALLVSPYGYHYDMPAVSLGFLLGLYGEKSPVRTLAFSTALMLPVLVRYGAWVAPPIMLLALSAQVTGSKSEGSGSRAPEPVAAS